MSKKLLTDGQTDGWTTQKYSWEPRKIKRYYLVRVEK